MKMFLTMAALLSLPSSALAQQLYAPAPPANSAFVRVVGAASGTLGASAVIAGKDAASPYVVIPQGNITAKVEGISQGFNVQAGKFYSVVAMGGKLTLLTDQAADNKAKVLLTVYNLSKSTIDLKTANGKLSVVANVKPGESGSRSVNGITVDLAAFASTSILGMLKGVKLERGNAYAIVVTETGATVTQSVTK